MIKYDSKKHNSGKWEKSWSEILKSNVYSIPTKGINYGGSSEKSNLVKIFRMRGTKKNKFYDQLFYILRFILWKENLDHNPFSDYLDSVKNKNLKDSDIYSKLKKIYDKEKTNIVDKEKDFSRGFNRSKGIAKLLDTINFKPESYLDYGCGSGEFTTSIGEELGLGKENIFGADTTKYREYKEFNFTLIENNKLPYEDNSFDFITVFMVLHHIKDDDLKNSINELYRILKPGGVLILREHNVPKKDSKPLHILLDFMHDFYDDIMISDTSWKDSGKYYAKYQSQEEWDTLLQNVGFSLNDFQPFFNKDYKKNAILKFMRIYRKMENNWNDILIDDKLKEFYRILNNENYPRLKYEKNTINESKKVIHWGQRKLLLSEIEFLTLFYQKKKPMKKIYVIYAGSAPGTHIFYLYKLFPQIKFILYDPREFCKKLNSIENVETNVEYFTEDIANKWKSENHPDKHILLISDIRTADIKTMKLDEIEKYVKKDHSMQKKWYNTMKPDATMLKFRLPWNNKKTKYIKGDIYIQVYAPKSSTETRLIIWDGESPDKYYDNKEYEEQMFWFNKKGRVQDFVNPLYDISSDKKNGLNNKYDSVGEISIIKNYLENFNHSHDNNNIIKISKEITKELHEYRTLCDF